MGPIRRAIEEAEPVDVGPAHDETAAAADPDGGDGGGPPDDDPPDLPEGGEPPDWPLIRACAGEPETDIGNGRRFLIANRDKVLHVQRIGYHVYDGARWREDVEGALVRPLAHRSAERIAYEAACLKPTKRERGQLDSGDPKTMTEARKALRERRARRVRFAKTSGNKARLDAMLGEAAPYVAVPVNRLDAEPLALNCLSGTLRLVGEPDPECPDPDTERHSWTVRLDPHRREDLISKVIPVDYDTRAAAPVFETFLARVLPDAEVRGFVQRYLGYCLTALTHEQAFVFFWGQGRNGKSTLVDTICRIFGDYAASVPFESLAGDDRRKGSEATPDLARLPGARLVRTAEPEQKMKFREATIKSLTSGEPILVRRLHADFIEVYPTFKLLVSGNHKPTIEGTDEGIWRRVLLVPWEVQIPRDEIDRGLPEKLWDERAGILNWLIDGAIAYHGRGLDPPEAVRAATASYREESDPIGSFLVGACDITGAEHDFETPGGLYDAYTRFCKREGFNAWQPTTFTRRLPERAAQLGFRKAKSMGNTIYRGLRIRAEFAGPAEDDGEGRIPL